jgi:putative copper export protein
LPAGSPLAAGFGVGFGGLVTLVLGGFTVFNVQIYRPRSPELSGLLYDLAFGMLAMSGIPAAVALGCFAIAVYRHHVLRRSTGHIAAVAAVAHVFLLVAFIAPTGPLSLQGFLVVWGIPLLLFAWIGHTARTITPGSAIES